MVKNTYLLKLKNDSNKFNDLPYKFIIFVKMHLSVSFMNKSSMY